ncbi:5-Enolpyruvylshikimate-3-phosphate synthase [Thermococcus sp. 2319x1]|uniref:3-phosphoshikimate 1-carboxyvinyltransferase n=1 Tax=Thermococcus sp. 2319x1 TaxID=1674923 RepID=UPI00073A7E50|nr:3-phosphoshikimate 1-carboxyvinyltransferase [Thermococcus sp. 2319x1]ALV62718.1 5-Enolpyruvylshikimate-3-phosphate synthase [Thermococcus sp. 2319x1]
MIITPVDEIRGELEALPSKSYTHRAYFLALLAEEESTIENPLFCDDTLATVSAIRAFGAEVNGKTVSPPEEPSPGFVYARESGTTARFSTALAGGINGRTLIDGARRLRERPMDGLVKALKDLGAGISSSHLPLAVKGPVKSGKVSVDASKSSQFVSGLLLLGAKVGLKVEAMNPVSRPYIEMTLRTMEAFGVEFEREGFSFEVYPGVRRAKYRVPGDYSTASFFLGAGALYGKVRINNLLRDDVQADIAFLDALEEFGAKVRRGSDYVEVERGELKAITLDCSDFPDSFPILAVIAAYAEGKSVIRAKQLRFKESDRVRAMAVNLSRMGIKVRELGDGLEIEGGRPKGARIETFKDHRIAMAMSIAALGAEGPSVIEDTESVSKSYPGFFDDLRRLLG